MKSHSDGNGFENISDYLLSRIRLIVTNTVWTCIVLNLEKCS
jgi:hypothetical protein